MKKFIAVLLVAVMVIGNSMVVLADQSTIDRNGGTATKNVTGTYTLNTSGTVYSVEISWGEMKFQCTQQGSWSTQNHTYTTDGIEPIWSPSDNGTSNAITVINHTNQQVNVGLNFVPNTADGNRKLENVRGDFYENNNQNPIRTLTVVTAEGTQQSDPPSKVAYLRLSGKPKEFTAGRHDVTFGTITVTIN